MRSMRSRQLTFVFADSPLGGKEANAADVSAGKAHLLRITKSMPTNDLSAPAAGMSQLLNRVASPFNLAKALLNVARNKGAPGVDGRSCRSPGWSRRR